MKQDKLITAIKSDFNAIDRVCDLLDNGYIIIDKAYDHRNDLTQYHLRKTPFTALMTKLSKKL